MSPSEGLGTLGTVFCRPVGHFFLSTLIKTIYYRYVEVLDKYFGSVCELDIIFNFEKAYFILDELILGGEMQVKQFGIRIQLRTRGCSPRKLQKRLSSLKLSKLTSSRR